MKIKKNNKTKTEAKKENGKGEEEEKLIQKLKGKRSL